MGGVYDNSLSWVFFLLGIHYAFMWGITIIIISLGLGAAL